MYIPDVYIESNSKEGYQIKNTSSLGVQTQDSSQVQQITQSTPFTNPTIILFSIGVLVIISKLQKN